MAARRVATAVVLALVALAALAGQASASPGALKILIVYSDGSHTEDKIRNKLLAEPGVAAVDRFDAGAATPTLAALQTYDVVIPYSSTDFADSTLLGSRLADFADAGGVVIEFDFVWTTRAQRQLLGRWSTDGYSPYTVGASASQFPPVTLGVHDAASPLLSGVTNLDTEYKMPTGLAPGAVEVAKWSDGNSAVAFKGRAVGVNTCVADGCSGATGQFARLIVNAATARFVGQLVTPDQGCQPKTFLQTGVATGNSYTVPLTGVISSWYFRSADPVLSGLKLKVGRAAGPASLTVVGESPAGSQIANQANGPYPVRIPVRAGDATGLSTTGTGLCADSTALSGDTYEIADGDPPPTTTTAFTTSGQSRFSVESVVEPDNDADGFGDMTQDNCLGIAGTTRGCRPGSSGATAPPGTGAVPPARVTNASQTNARWREPKHSRLTQISRRRARVGTTFQFSLDKPAGVGLRFTQRATGRRVRARCTRVTKRNRKRPKCTRRVARGTLAANGHTGVNRVRFSGWLSRTKKLKPGRYTLVITATTPGAGSTSAKLNFTIVK
jgi:hypothetical protein